MHGPLTGTADITIGITGIPYMCITSQDVELVRYVGPHKRKLPFLSFVYIGKGRIQQGMAILHQITAVALWVAILRARHLAGYPRAASLRGAPA